jgi:hypothetical protein
MEMAEQQKMGMGDQSMINTKGTENSWRNSLV